MSSALLSKTWSTGSLDIGRRHLIQVKEEFQDERTRMEMELEACDVPLVTSTIVSTWAGTGEGAQGPHNPFGKPS